MANRTESPSRLMWEGSDRAAIAGGGDRPGKNTLPESGSILGVDVGCSPTRRSSAVCRLDWNPVRITWTIERFAANESERPKTLQRLADRPLLVAAFDGPLCGDLEVIGRYRHAERMLTRGLQPLIGKPGQSSTPVGRGLNLHANSCAQTILATGQLLSATHAHAIHAKAIVEAFPSTFLGLLIERPEALHTKRNKRSDDFYEHLVEVGTPSHLLDWLLPARQTSSRFEEVTNHDDRAALICALSALCVAAGEYGAVGDSDGWIVLPPQPFVRPWAISHLENNAKERGGLAWSEPTRPITPTRPQPAAARTLPHQGGGILSTSRSIR
jgi:Protein of unknown function (DUF429)